MAYAHSRNDRGQRHDLVAHLRGTAELAAEFAEAVGAQKAGYYLGLWHDLGKFDQPFQDYLLACEAGTSSRGRGPDHKAAGSLLAAGKVGLAALLIQGHHGGLKAPNDLRAWLDERRREPAVARSLELARQAVADLEPTSQIPLPSQADRDKLAAELFLRLLFSCLVDADFLDTERHFQAERADLRGPGISVAELWARLELDQAARFAHAPATAVNAARREVFDACLAAAERPPGLFRLTVPTGGGKTRSAMAFALRHALLHGQRRVVVAVPYLTITEQTADVYREIFRAADDDRPVVLEHHSNLACPAGDEEGFLPADVWARLAAENWDAPIIVTTTVQLFESLFANQTSRCRKLHRLARSVLILDEAQALPPHLLETILDGLRQLCTDYGTTIVLSTATQPAFEAIPLFSQVPAREIVPNAARYFEALRRVEYDYRLAEALEWKTAADLIREERQALAVLNTKRDALALLDALDDPEALHLSTLLCGAHRRSVIRQVRSRLEQDAPCRLVSTQVVEAGVDLDFPLVLRALGPLDGIIQAAGRCNREGRLERGRIVVFRPATGGTPPGSYRTATDITRGLLGREGVDLDNPGVPHFYYRQLFESVSTDRERIQALREGLEYPTTAQHFRMIDDDTESVVITTYGSPAEQARVAKLLDRLQQGSSNQRALRRRLQPYVVSVFAKEARKYEREGFIAPLAPGLGIWQGAYDPVRGLVGSDPDPDRWIV